MKPHRIHKSFRGSQDGINTEHFEAGTVRNLSPSLAAIVVKEGWADAHSSKAEDRETKVIEPEETKAEALDTMAYKDLLALAKDRGITMQPGMKKEALIKALQEAA